MQRFLMKYGQIWIMLGSLHQMSRVSGKVSRLNANLQGVSSAIGYMGHVSLAQFLQFVAG